MDTTQNIYINKIKDFVGKGGFCPFEHGFTMPQIKISRHKVSIWGVSDTHIHLHVPLKLRKKIDNRVIPFENLKIDDLKTIDEALNKYLIYCQTEA